MFKLTIFPIKIVFLCSLKAKPVFNLMKPNFFIFTFFLCLMSHFGQSQSQSLHKILGKILDIHTQEPIKASIHFTCLNNDGYLGFIENDASLGNYELSLLKNKDYCVKISAPNYITIIDTISLHNMIQKNYHLNPLYPFDMLIFKTGKDDLMKNSEYVLKKTIQILNQFPDFTIQLEGHTDYAGSNQLNLELSEQRALRIKEDLIKAGISPKRIKIKAFGGSKPLIRSHDVHERNNNQRVEIRFLN